MSASPSSVTTRDVPSIVAAEPVEFSSTKRLVLMVCIAIGVVSFLFELFSGDPRHAWAAYHVNFLYWFCMSAASTCFAAVFQICNAQWARPIRRIFESATYFFTIGPVLLIIAYFGHAHLFSWATHPVEGKESWLTSNFVFGRDLVAMLLLIAVGRRIIYYSLRRDLGVIRSDSALVGSKSSRWANVQYDCYVSGWGKDYSWELTELRNRMGRLAPIVVMVYALAMSLLAFDLIMSVDPHWYSTLFGAFVFMAAVYGAVAFAAMGVGFARTMHPLYRAKIERRTLHDLGKLLFGFGIFWAYLFWSHYLTIWYANIPEETKWVITRARLAPWHGFAWLVLATCFFIPFFLGLSRDVKQIPQLLFATGAIVAAGLWLFFYILFVPTIFPDHVPFGLTDVGVTLGFFGLYALLAVRYLANVPVIPFGDLCAVSAKSDLSH